MQLCSAPAAVCSTGRRSRSRESLQIPADVLGYLGKGQRSYLLSGSRSQGDSWEEKAQPAAGKRSRSLRGVLVEFPPGIGAGSLTDCPFSQIDPRLCRFPPLPAASHTGSSEMLQAEQRQADSFRFRPPK